MSLPAKFSASPQGIRVAEQRRIIRHFPHVFAPENALQVWMIAIPLYLLGQKLLQAINVLRGEQAVIDDMADILLGALAETGEEGLAMIELDIVATSGTLLPSDSSGENMLGLGIRASHKPYRHQFT